MDEDIATRQTPRHVLSPLPRAMHRLLGLSLLLFGLLVIPLSHSTISGTPKGTGTVLSYARQCEKHLGPLPNFSCSKAVEIPITQNGKRVFQDVDWCDMPAAFGDPCQVGNRVGLIQGTYENGDPRPEVMFVSFCRDGGIGVIGHNHSTGATCFFSIEERGVDAFGVIPGPNDPGYERAWQSPKVVAKDGCSKCHMADPFLHTPWIDQVRDPANPSEPLVPLIASDTSPYFVVGDEFSQPPGSDVIPLEDNKCTECHRAQCIPDFFHVKLGELEMPPPFYEIHKDTDPEMAADRALLNAWCKSLKIDYFPEN